VRDDGGLDPESEGKVVTTGDRVTLSLDAEALRSIIREEVDEALAARQRTPEPSSSPYMTASEAPRSCAAASVAYTNSLATGV